MPFAPNIHGQLGWDPDKEQVQYSISWNISNNPSDKITSAYGSFEVISEERASNVAVATILVAAKTAKTVHHANGKFAIEIPAEATSDGQDLYIAASSGYNIDPPNGRIYVAGGVVYNTTAFKLGDKVEVSELYPNVTMRFYYASSLNADSLDICQINDDGDWEPASGTETIADGVATLTTSRLGAYALMLRKSDPLAEAVKAMQEATQAMQAQIA